jgi:hypothetical protein
MKMQIDHLPLERRPAPVAWFALAGEAAKTSFGAPNPDIHLADQSVTVLEASQYWIHTPGVVLVL